jgi:alpha-tubulin suppressor-like RCC1 family protein
MFVDPSSVRQEWGPWSLLTVACLACLVLSACEPGEDDEDRDRALVRRWLFCEECSKGELDSLRVPERRDRVVPLLAEALKGPPVVHRDNARRQLEEDYVQLLQAARSRNDTVRLDREQYTSHFLGNYRARYQSHAIAGLVAIGTPEAKAVLTEAFDSVQVGAWSYRSDVVEQLIRAVRGSVGGLTIPWTTITAGFQRSCGTRRDGKSYCWGRNDLGQLGDGTTHGHRLTPSLVAGSQVFQRIAAGGGSHTCGRTGQTVYCWGGNRHGELGDGSTTNRRVPTLAASGRAFEGVAVGGSQTCAWTSVGEAFCWGGNSVGQLGDGTTTGRHQPVAVAGGMRFESIAAGAMHTCADSLGGQVYCWGLNSDGQLGDGSYDNDSTPVMVAGPLRLQSMSLGTAHWCGLDTLAGFEAAYCVGRNTDGRLGDGTTTSTNTLVKVTGGYRFKAISAGGRHTCAIESGTDRMLCWGDNAYGQLGDGTRDDRWAPTPVDGNRRFSVVSVGPDHTCGVVLPNEAAYCWGLNSEGQLGNGTRTNRLRPDSVLAP